MKTVKRSWILSVVMVLAFVSSVCPALGANYNFKLGHVTQTSHPFHPAATLFADAVKSKTGGQVEITVYPARQLGDDKALMEGVQLGTIEMAVISTAIFDLITPILNALQLPWLIEDYSKAEKVYGSPALQNLMAGLAKFNIKGLGVYEGGFRHFINTKGPINTIEDFKGLKTRVVPAALHLAIWKALGASPTPMAYGEVYTSLQTGVLDSAEMNLTSIYSEKYYEVAKYVSLTGQYMWPGILVINKKLFDSLPKDIQAKMEEAAKEILSKQIAETKAMDDRAVEFLKKQNIPINNVKNLQPMIKAVEPVFKEYEGKDPAIGQFVTAVRAIK